MSVQFRLLGSVEAVVNGRRVDLGHARQRCVLAALLVDADRVVPVDVVLDRVWADRLPAKARITLSGYVSRLRALLAPAAEVSLTHQFGGYRLAVDPAAVDLHQFRALVGQARAATGEDRRAALFSQALELWRGPAFATLDMPWLDEVRDELAAERLGVELDRNDLVLEQGQHAALLADLSACAAAHPWDERLAGQLMLALYRCGRQAEALRHYDRLRSRLAHELGADPSRPLQQLHQRILNNDPNLTVARGGNAAVPRQLPVPCGAFAGRARELAGLDAVMRSEPSTVVISAVSGTAGVGKTALALHWAHRVADEFPDGQLYVNLRGFDPAGATPHPGEAVRGFLDALGVPPHRIPDGLDAQASLYRSLLTGRRVLVVLDNARDVGQVRPLLPGTSGCLVVVTSRNQLTGLVVGEGAYPLVLDLLSPDEARELLAKHIGLDRVAAEPEAVDEIIDRCARLPLALAVVAARAAIHPRFPLHTLAAELRDGGRLDVLAGADPVTDPRVVFSWSYQALGDGAARLFRLLGLHPGPDIAVAAAASLTGLPLPRVRPLLTELTRAHLLTEHVPGRYTFHDLLRAYAAEQAQHHDTDADRRAATHRMLDHYLHTAHAASRWLDPHQGDPVCLPPARAGVLVTELAGQEQATAWFAAELPAILAAVEHAERHGFESYTWSLNRGLCEYSYQRGHWLELAGASHIALRAAERLADVRGKAHAHRGLGIAHRLQGRHEEANRDLQRALALYASLGDHGTQAVVHCSVGTVLAKLGRPLEALDHARQAMDLQRATGDRVGQARALNSVGWYHVELGDHRRALTYLEEARALIEQTDDRLGQAAILDSLGFAHHHLAQHRQAVECYEHALRLARDIGNRYLEAESLTHLGDTHHAAGDTEPAHDAWQRSLTILAAFDYPEADDVRAKLNALKEVADRG